MCVCDALEAVSMQKSHRSVSSAVELRQAIVAMMNRKDELEEQNTYVLLPAACKLSNAPSHTRT